MQLPKFYLGFRPIELTFLEWVIITTREIVWFAFGVDVLVAVLHTRHGHMYARDGRVLTSVLARL